MASIAMTSPNAATRVQNAVAAAVPAAPRCGCDVIVESQRCIAPFPLVWFVSDSEIKASQAKPNRVAQKITKVRRAGTEAGQLTAVVARQYMIVTVAERESEICGRRGCSDFQTADMDQIAHSRVGCEVKKEFAMSRLREDVCDAHARQGLALLAHERFERARGIIFIGGVDEADFAVLGQTLALGAISPASRRGALGGVEFLPVAAQLRQICAARVERDIEVEKWIGLGANHFRHFLQLNPIVAQQRIALQEIPNLLPHGEEAARRYALRKVTCEQRGVVIAQVLTKPGYSSEDMLRIFCERQHEKDFAIGTPADDDGRDDTCALSDMPVPGRKPIKRLERSAIGNLFERAPIRCDRVHVVVYGQANVRPRSARWN